MPVAGTEIAARIDNLYAFLLVVSFIACAILIGGMIYFVFKYKRKKPGQVGAYISHNLALEFTWSFVPLVIFLFVFAWGWVIYHDMRAMPENAREIQVTAKMWGWTYKYKDGRNSDVLVVPIGEPIKLVMNSEDVIHSFYVPSFRLKQDVVPGKYTAIWFQVEKPGDYTVFCTEYCGAGHSAMLSKITAVTPEEYNDWLSESQPLIGMVEQGGKVFAAQSCAGCHSVDNSMARGIGPSLKNLFGKTITLDGGKQVVVDENYLRESILYPARSARREYAASKGQMPLYQSTLSEGEVSALIEYIKHLGGSPEGSIQ